MIDEYLLRYILEYLRECNKCNKLTLNNYSRICILCKDFCCENCEMIRDYTEYEVTGLYCYNCHTQNFTY